MNNVFTRFMCLDLGVCFLAFYDNPVAHFFGGGLLMWYVLMENTK